VPEYRLVKFRGKWAVAYQGERGIVRRSLGTADASEAKAAFADFVAKLDRPKAVTVRYLWGAYRRDKAAKRIALNMDYSGRALLPELGDVRPEHVTADLCRSYIAKRRKAGKKDGTIWTEMNHLRIVLNWALKCKIIAEAGNVEPPRKPDPKERRITRAEARRLIEAAEPEHVKLAITLMLGTAARAGAILALKWSQVDFAAGLISYRDPEDAGHRKGRATVPMVGQVREAMVAAKRSAQSEYVIEWAGKPVTTIKRGFASSVERAGLKNVTPHVLRHSAATFMAEAGRPMTEIASVLGHSDSSITERVYAKFSPTHLRAAVSALDLSDVPSCSSELSTPDKSG